MRMIALFVTTLLCGCGPPLGSGSSAPDVSLAVEPAAASTGESITLLLRNESSGAIGYNLCTSGLERQVGGDWQAVPSDRVCTMELRTLEPGQQARHAAELPGGLPPGRYRYHTTVERLGAGLRDAVRSEPFRVGS